MPAVVRVAPRLQLMPPQPHCPQSSAPSHLSPVLCPQSSAPNPLSPVLCAQSPVLCPKSFLSISPIESIRHVLSSIFCVEKLPHHSRAHCNGGATASCGGVGGAACICGAVGGRGLGSAGWLPVCPPPPPPFSSGCSRLPAGGLWPPHE